MFSGLTSLSFAGAQPQELSPWFFSQNLWLSSGIALGSDCQMASDQPVVKFYLLQNPRIICVEVEDFLGLLKTQKLTTTVSWYQPSSTRLPFSQIGGHFRSATVHNIPFETCRYVSLCLILFRDHCRPMNGQLLLSATNCKHWAKICKEKHLTKNMRRKYFNSNHCQNSSQKWKYMSMKGL